MGIFASLQWVPGGSCCLQHYMSMFVSSLTIPILLAPAMCMEEDNVGKSEIIGTLFVTSGIITLMQNIIGVRYVDHGPLLTWYKQ